MSKKPTQTKNDDCVVGTIAYFGNEPFVKMVIKAEDKNVYTISADEVVLEAVKKEFGKMIEFHGTLKKSETEFSPNYDGVFEISYFEVKE